MTAVGLQRVGGSENEGPGDCWLQQLRRFVLCVCRPGIEPTAPRTLRCSTAVPVESSVQSASSASSARCFQLPERRMTLRRQSGGSVMSQFSSLIRTRCGSSSQSAAGLPSSDLITEAHKRRRHCDCAAHNKQRVAVAVARKSHNSKVACFFCD